MTIWLTLGVAFVILGGLGCGAEPAPAPPPAQSEPDRRGLVAFRQDGNAHVVETPRYRALVTSTGLAMTARHPWRAIQPIGIQEERPLVLEPAEIARGAANLEMARDAERTEEAGVLALERAGGIVERLEATSEGVAQSWVVPAAPSGRGDLVVSVRVSGRVYEGETPGCLRFADPDRGVGICYGEATWIDAGGRRTRVDRRFEGDRIVISVPESVIESSAFPALLDPVLSPEIAMDDPSADVGPALGDQSGPRIVWGAGNYLAAWNDSRGGVWGARIAPDGAVVGPAGFVVAPDGKNPELAFDGASWVVVHERSLGYNQKEIRATRVALDGTVLDPDGILVTAAAWAEAPDVAFDGTNHLVVWLDGGVRAARMTPSGMVLDSPALTIDTGALAYAKPAVAFDGSVYLVAWNGYCQNMYAPCGVRVAPGGTLLDASPIHIDTPTETGPVPLDVAAGPSGFRVASFFYNYSPVQWVGFTSGVTSGGAPSASVILPLSSQPNAYQSGGHPARIAFDGTKFLVTWFEGKVLRVATDGTPIDVGPLSPAHASSIPAVASDGADFFVAWDETNGLTGSDAWGRRILASGQLDSPGLLATGPSVERSPAAAFDGQTYFVVWSDSRGGSLDIYGARVEPDGDTLDPNGIPICTAPGSQADPVVSFDGTNFLVAWWDDRGPPVGVKSAIYGARVTPAGTVLGEVAISTNPSYLRGPPALSLGTSSHLVVWSASGGTNGIVGARVALDGTALDPQGIPIDDAFGARPRVAFDGTNHLVVKARSVQVGGSTNESIEGVRVGEDGIVVDATPFEISALVRDQVSPAVAFDGSQYLVVWQESVPLDDDGEADVMGARVSPNGAVLDPLGLIIGKASGKQGAPTVAFDGAAFLVAWEDRQVDPAADVRMARIDETGKLLDNPPGIAVATGPEGQAAAAIASDGAGHALVVFQAGIDGADKISGRLVTDLPLGSQCGSFDECVSGHCVDGVCCDAACGQACDVCTQALGATQDGACTLAPPTFACGSYACTGLDASCPTSCTSDAGCAASAYCEETGHCVQRKAIGSACDADAGADCLVSGCRVCATDHCADGFCCDTACDQPCDVCAAQLGADADGSCGLAVLGYEGSPICAPSKCSGASASCSPTCDDDADCAGDHFCKSSVCVPDEPDAEACASAEQCSSGHCVDGVCCATACLGQCEACDVPGQVGVCSPVDGEPPHASHEPCPAGTADEPCSLQVCREGACGPVVGAPCRQAACDGDQLALAAVCDGTGVCPAAVTKTCVPFTCKDAACGQDPCDGDDDCAAGYRCEAEACVQGATCDGDHTVTLADGTTVDCSPHRCSDDGTCRTTCGSIADCVTGHTCSAGGVCEPLRPATDPPSSCACRTVGAPQRDLHGVLAAVALALVAARRRRRWIRAIGMSSLTLVAACSGGGAEQPESSRARPQTTGFSRDGDGWTAKAARHSVHVSVDGITLAPAEGGSAPLTLDAASIRRGGHALSSRASSARTDAGGRLEIERGSIVERLESRAEGAEQSWVFAERPAGDGDLELALAAHGLPLRAETASGLSFGDRASAGVRYGIATWIDARGARTTIRPRWSSGAIVLSVPAAVVDGSAYPAVLDPLISPEIGLDAPILGPGPGVDDHPAIASDGTSYLVVWQDVTFGEIRAKRVAADGTPLDGGGALLATTGSKPSLAFDGTSYLVAWQDIRNSLEDPNGGLDIYGTRVSTTGTSLDGAGIPISVQPGAEYSPAVGSSGPGFFVAWEGGKGRRVFGDGALDDIVSLEANPQYSCAPAIASNGSKLRVVYVQCSPNINDGAKSIRAVDFTPAGAVLGESTLFTADYNHYLYTPDVGSDGSDFLAAWHFSYFTEVKTTLTSPGSFYGGEAPAIAFDGTNYVLVMLYGDTIVATRITPGGAVLDQPPVPVGPALPVNDYPYLGPFPDVASNGTSSQVAWTSPSADIHGARVSGDGQLLDATGIDLSQGMNRQERPRVAFDGQNYLAVWSDTRSGQHDVYGVRVSAAGGVIDAAAIPISTAPVGQPNVAVAFGGGTYLVVWGGGCARVQPDGTVVDTVPIPAGGNAVAFGDGSFLVVGDSVSRRVALDGTVLDPSGIAAGGAAVAYNGESFLVVGPSSSRRVALDGTVLDPAGIAVGGSAVAWDGQSHLVVREATADLFATRVALDGTILDVAPIAVSYQVGAQTAPQVVFDGTEFFVVWQDLRTDVSGDLFGARVSSAGQLRDDVLLGLELAGGSDGAISPGLATDGAGRTLLAYSQRDPAPPMGGAPRAFARVVSNLPLGAPCAAGTECSSGSCSDGVCCNASCGGACDVCSAALAASADGACTVVDASVALVCNATSLCDGASAACPTSCTSDASCAPGAHCDEDGLCAFSKELGEPCDDSAGADCLVGGCPVCLSGHCVDGVCCDAACGESCDVCTEVLGAPADGTCGPAPAGALGSPSCAPGECNGVSIDCASTCAGDLDCVPSAHCARGVCTPDGPNGQACTSASACTSGHCVDGWCCDSVCFGQCEACDAAGYEGTCTPVAGPPHGDRPPCFDGDGADPCTAETCDGTGSCAPVEGISCRETSCDGDALVGAATCDGSGSCPAVAQPCVPFTCAQAACKQGPCAQDSDCAAGYRCDDGDCVEGPRCDGAHTVTLVGGELQDCSPYRCDAAGTCLQACGSTADCAAGRSCSADGRCETASSSSPPTDAGCGCRVVGDDRRDAPLPLCALAALSWAAGRMLRGQRRRSRAR